MKRVLRGKVGPVVSLLLILTVGILLGITTVSAQGTEDIAPDQSLQPVLTLLQGQSASLSVTQTTPFGVKSVLVCTIGNRTLGASLTPRGSASGFWFLMVIGTGRSYADFSFGLLPWPGQRATVDMNVNDKRFFGLVLSMVSYVTLPEGGGSYGLSIGQ